MANLAKSQFPTPPKVRQYAITVPTRGVMLYTVEATSAEEALAKHEDGQSDPAHEEVLWYGKGRAKIYRGTIR